MISHAEKSQIKYRNLSGNKCDICEIRQDI